MLLPSKRTIVLIDVVIFQVIFGVVYFSRRAAQNQAYLYELKALSFDKYLDLPRGYADVRRIGGWDA